MAILSRLSLETCSIQQPPSPDAIELCDVLFPRISILSRFGRNPPLEGEGTKQRNWVGPATCLPTASTRIYLYIENSNALQALSAGKNTILKRRDV
jgi:hypothetical protein